MPPDNIAALQEAFQANASAFTAGLKKITDSVGEMNARMTDVEVDKARTSG